VRESLKTLVRSRPKPALIQPAFVTPLPNELVPLAKLSPDDRTTGGSLRVLHQRPGNCARLREQNDPIAQRTTLESRACGTSGEQQKVDEGFLVALEHGMLRRAASALGLIGSVPRLRDSSARKASAT
jgi:lysyl-tRNA synthetase, class II